MKPKVKSLGMIDLAFGGPEISDGPPKKPDLPDLCIVLNLHGDPRKLHVQFEFLKLYSDVLIVLPEQKELMKEAGLEGADLPLLVIHEFKEFYPSQYGQKCKEFSYHGSDCGLIAERQF
jgi:hypothetical protein